MLPKRTDEEQRGIILVEDYFDYQVDYTKGGPLPPVKDLETLRLMRIGLERLDSEIKEDCENYEKTHTSIL